ncbi:MAG: hypothetical protein QM756_25225 [Polyangiaceae bacterium]
MAKNRFFLPQEQLDRWLERGSVELSSDELMIFPHRRRYRLVEAVRVVSEVTGARDSFEIVGRVKSVGYLLELGAELLGDSMIVGDAAFQVVPGWLGSPIGTFSDYCLELGPAPARAENDIELFARFASRNP